MEVFIENVIIYSFVALVLLGLIVFYIRDKNKKSKIVEAEILKAKESGLYEPISLHRVIDIGSCIQTGTLIEACPEKDILGIVRAKANTIFTKSWN